MKTIIGMASVAALALVALSTTAQYARAQAAAAAQPPAGKKTKQVKDTGEYDIYNDVIKDSQANPPNGKKFQTDLDTWTQKYPDTDFKDVRTMYYVQAAMANQDPGKALDTAKPLVDKGIDGLKEALDTPQFVLQFLFLTTGAGGAAAGKGASPDQLATGAKAAQLLSAYAKTYFAKENKPATMSDDDWAKGLAQVEDQAKGALFQMAFAPPAAKLNSNSKDPAVCAAAEDGFKKTAEQYPQSGAVASQMAKAALCQQATSPEKAQEALFLYARAVSLPTTGVGALTPADQKNLDDYLKKIYTVYHGSEEGLAQLKEAAAKSTMPPADFKIKSATQMSAEAEEEFRTKNPQLAVWMGVKKQLTDTAGEQYYETNMKGTMLAGENGAKFFKGTLIEAKPACRPKELIVAIPLPGAAATPEITLKIVDDQMKSVALTGKPETGGEIQFNGAPSAFTKDPFMLTLDSQKTDIDGLNMTPCAAAPPARKGPATAPKKKG